SLPAAMANNDCRILHQYVSATFDPASCCTQSGYFKCTAAGRVLSVKIADEPGATFLVSTDLPTLVQAFIQLPELTDLELSDNSLTGTIPDAIANLTAVTVLDLSENGLSGHVPQALAVQMPNLSELYLEYNQLTGPVPDFSRARHLTTLRMDGNCLTGGTQWTGGSYTPVNHASCGTNATSSSETSLPPPTATTTSSQSSDASSSAPARISTFLIGAIIGVTVLLIVITLAVLWFAFRSRRARRGTEKGKAAAADEIATGTPQEGPHNTPVAPLAAPVDSLHPLMTASTPTPPPRASSNVGYHPAGLLFPPSTGDPVIQVARAVAAANLEDVDPPGKSSVLFGEGVGPRQLAGTSSDGGQGASSSSVAGMGLKSTAVVDGLQDLESWTSADVKSWVLASGFDRGIAEKFELQGIAGKELLHLTMEELHDQLGIAPNAASVLFLALSSLKPKRSTTSAGKSTPDVVPPPYQE
ncbi:hypothetical protein HK101_000464, partial [Irineochytrium annulatum]